MVKYAISTCYTEIILGVGGSATNDGCAGIFQALGGNLKDKTGNEHNKGWGGKRIALKNSAQKFKSCQMESCLYFC